MVWGFPGISIGQDTQVNLHRAPSLYLAISTISTVSIFVDLLNEKEKNKEKRSENIYLVLAIHCRV